MEANGVMRIGKPRLEKLADGRTRLVSSVDMAGETKDVWIAVEDRFAQYLCSERGDAFLVGLLPVAYRRHLDVVCEAPIGEHLLYQLRNYLIPLISKYGRSVWPVEITADIDTTPIQNAGGVGTGISCGIDCLHAVKNHMNPKYPHLRLTHLVLNNVGAFGENRPEKTQFKWMQDHAKSFCNEYGFELIVLDSNFFDGLGLDFEQNSTYMNMFPVLALQKLWSVFIYASAGYDFQESYTLLNNDDRDPAHYDMLLLDSVSNPNLKIYNDGAPYSRYEKTRALVDFEPAQKYLEVCVSGKGGNCGKCFKCNRTLLTLDALGALDKFAAVFDIENYKKNRHWYLRYLYRTQISHSDKMLGHVYAMLKKDMFARDKILGLYDHILYRTKVTLRPMFEKLGLLKPQK